MKITNFVENNREPINPGSECETLSRYFSVAHKMFYPLRYGREDPERSPPACVSAKKKLVNHYISRFHRMSSNFLNELISN